MDEVQEPTFTTQDILDAMYEAGRQSALTVSPEKLEAAAVATHATDCGCSDNGGPHMIYYRGIARAAAIAFGLRLSDDVQQGISSA